MLLLMPRFSWTLSLKEMHLAGKRKNPQVKIILLPGDATFIVKFSTPKLVIAIYFRGELLTHFFSFYEITPIPSYFSKFCNHSMKLQTKYDTIHILSLFYICRKIVSFTTQNIVPLVVCLTLKSHGVLQGP